MRDGEAAVGDKNKKKGKLDEEINSALYTELSACCKKVFHAMSLSGVVSSAAPEGDELELEWIHGTLHFLSKFCLTHVLCTYIDVFVRNDNTFVT